MTDFRLDQRLQDDCFSLFELEGIHYLLNKNAEVVWFILVPCSQVTELFLLDNGLKTRLYSQIDRVSEYLELHFEVDKINVASIGNVVAQLHFHVVGRRRDDSYWPDVVWGKAYSQEYDEATVKSIRQSLAIFLNSSE